MARRRRGRDPGHSPVPGYRDFEQIARGGSATVFRAYQERFARHVAVKVLGVDITTPAAQAAFLHECAATGRLTGHPNIVTVLDSGFTDDGRAFLVMHYFERGTLAHRIERGERSSLEDVLRVGVKIAGALETAHRAGILHRDVKPQNILESQFGEPALADFGIAAAAGNASSPALTPAYAAPEVLAGGAATGSSDVYSLGATLFCLLAGRPAFAPANGEPLDQLARRIQATPVPPIARRDVPVVVADNIAQAMAPDPRMRFSSPAQFGQRLRELQRRLGLPVTELPLAGADPGTDPEIRLGGAVSGPSQPRVASAPAHTDRVPVASIRPRSAPGPATTRAATRRSEDPGTVSGTHEHAHSAADRVAAIVGAVALVVAVATIVAVLLLQRNGSHGGKSSATSLPVGPATAEPTGVTATWVGNGIRVQWSYASGTGTGYAAVSGVGFTTAAQTVTPGTTSVTLIPKGVAPATNACVQVIVFEPDRWTTRPVRACTGGTASSTAAPAAPAGP